MLDATKIFIYEYALSEAQAQAVAEFVWQDGHERGLDTDWDNYVRFAADLGSLAQKIIELQ